MRIHQLLLLPLLVIHCTDENTAFSPPDGNGSDLASSDILIKNEDAQDDLSFTPDLMPAPPPSCVALLKTCGPITNDDCCLSLPVPGGIYNRSNDPNAPATISPFLLDKYEITVGRFRAFMSAGQGTQASPPSAGSGAHLANTGWDAAWNANLAANTAALTAALKCDVSATWTDIPGPNETKPVNCTSWFDAFAFCTWDGGFLPTEAEWNYAAAGGPEQRPYPWSANMADLTIDPTRAVYGGAPIAPVGSKSPKGDGKWGHADLGGNAQEWVFDWYAPYTTPCVNCVGRPGSAARVLRSGGWSSGPAILRTEGRAFVTPTNRDNGGGFRCARN